MLASILPSAKNMDLLRDTVRRFAEKEIAPRAAQIDQTSGFPPDLWENWASWVCSASPCRPNTAVRAWATSHTWWRWRRSRAPRVRLASLTRAHSNLCVQQPLPQHQRRATHEIPAETVQRRVDRRAGHERAGRRFGRGRFHELPRRSSTAMNGSPTVPRCGSPTARMRTWRWCTCVPPARKLAPSA